MVLTVALILSTYFTVINNYEEKTLIVISFGNEFLYK